MVKHGADVIKVCATGGVLSLGDDVDSAQLTQLELDAIVDEAHAKTSARSPCARPREPTGVKRAIKAGARLDSEHGTFLDDASAHLT